MYHHLNIKHQLFDIQFDIADLYDDTVNDSVILTFT